MLSINIHDIRINKDINALTTLSSVSSDGTDGIIGGDDGRVDSGTIPSAGDDIPEIVRSSKALDFRHKKVPPSIITFAQFVAIHVHNISVVLMNNSLEPNWFVHATVKELHLDGSIVLNTKSLIVTAALNDAEAKVLRHYPPLNRTTAGLSAATAAAAAVKNKPCMVELSFGISLDAVLMAQGPLSLEKIQLTMNHTKTTVHGGLYDFIRDVKTEKKRTGGAATGTAAKSSSLPMDNNDLYQRISPIIPKVCHL